MSYLKAYDKLIEVDFEPYKLTETICDAGYLKTLDAGAIVRIGKTWTNFYGRWTSIYDLEGRCYDIHPEEVKNVTEKLETKETIEEWCDEFVQIIDGKPVIDNAENCVFVACKRMLGEIKDTYGAIWTDKGLVYVAKLNEKGILELL